MEPEPLTSYGTGKSLCLFKGSSSRDDPDVMELMPSNGLLSIQQQKRKRNQVVPHEIIEIDEEEIVNNQEAPKYDKVNFKNNLKDIQDALFKDIETNISQHTNQALENGAFLFLPEGSSHMQGVGASTAASDPFDTPDYGLMDVEEDWDDEETMDFLGDFDDFGELPASGVDTKPWLKIREGMEPVTSSSAIPTMLGSGKLTKEKDEIDKNFKEFKQFDTVSDYSDHYFNSTNRQNRGSYYGHFSKNKAVADPTRKIQPAKPAPGDWTKKVQQEWRLLEKDLPDSIFVRIYEDRMDLIRAVIIGAAGTPYHDGLFFFDIFFPSTYPVEPPLVHYFSGGLRLNPNLYACGKVCLSLLNTWHGTKNEQWTPGSSTILQVLLSIQAIILNAKPYFNEPGYERAAGTPAGEKKALSYNEDTFILSLKTMLNILRNPPKHFEDFVLGHFRANAFCILLACKSYMEGAQVGCLSGGGVQDVDEGDKSSSLSFRTTLSQFFPRLVKAFTEIGVGDCQQFLD